MMDQSINMNGILQNAQEITPVRNITADSVLKGNGVQPQQDLVPPVNTTVPVQQPTLGVETHTSVPMEEEVPNIGKGLIIENKPKAEDGIKVGMTAAGMDRVSAYLAEMDEEIKHQAEIKEEILEKMEEKKTEEDEEENNDGELTADELADKYKEAVVIIDKAGIGSIINFTEEERAKMERSKVIKVQEIENVDLQVKKTKKVLSSKKLNKILEKKAASYTSHIVLPVSGYTAEMSSCSTYELLSLVLADQSEANDVLSRQKKWSLIHSKLKSTSLGKMSFDTFMRKTANLDFNMFVFGILSATYGTQDKTIPFNCESCGVEFNEKLDVRSLLRAERMSDRLGKLVMGAVDNSYTKDDAEKYYQEEAPVSQTKLIKLPVSEFLVELQIQSAYDNVNKSLDFITEIGKKDKIKGQLAIIATAISRIIIPDDECPEEPYEVDAIEDIVEVLYTLKDVDVNILADQTSNYADGLSFDYGMLNLQCPKCGNITKYVPLNIESLLFFLTQEEATKTIE